MPNMDDIHRLAQHDPTVAACLQAHENGMCTLQEALITMVVALAEGKRHFMEMSLQLTKTTSTVYVFERDSLVPKPSKM